MITPKKKVSKLGPKNTLPRVPPEFGGSRGTEHNTAWPNVFGDGEVRAVGRLAAVLAVIAILLIVVATLN